MKWAINIAGTIHLTASQVVVAVETETVQQHTKWVAEIRLWPMQVFVGVTIYNHIVTRSFRLLVLMK